jgi:serine/threonine protein kinase
MHTNKRDSMSSALREATLQSIAAKVAKGVPQLHSVGPETLWHPQSFLIMDKLDKSKAVKAADITRPLFMKLALSLLQIVHDMLTAGISHNDLFITTAGAFGKVVENHNIILSSDGSVQVFDFGEACLLFFDQKTHPHLHAFSCHQFNHEQNPKMWHTVPLGFSGYRDASDVMNYLVEIFSESRLGKSKEVIDVALGNRLKELAGTLLKEKNDMDIYAHVVPPLSPVKSVKGDCTSYLHPEGQLADRLHNVARKATFQATQTLLKAIELLK